MIETGRLRLRGWRDDDLPGFVAATNTPAVMAHLGGVRPPAAFHGLPAAQRALAARCGHCFWVVERRTDRRLLGFCGLEPTDLPGTPVADEVEIGWRFREDAWGRGYATEAARATLAWAWARTGLRRVVALTVAANGPSRRLVERLGMARRPDLDFDHPAFAPGHPLRAHLVDAVDRPRPAADGLSAGAGRAP